jgi:hypothetical protein
MKTARTLLAAALAGLGLAAVCAPASAAPPGGGYHGHGYYGGYRGPYWGGYWGPRVTFGYYGGPWVWGPGYWGGWGYPYGYAYAAPPVVVVPSQPQVYVERDDAAQAGGQAQWWYWCASSKGYYPYVSTCSEGWQRVAPQPPQATQ